MGWARMTSADGATSSRGNSEKKRLTTASPSTESISRPAWPSNSSRKPAQQRDRSVRGDGPHVLQVHPRLRRRRAGPLRLPLHPHRLQHQVPAVVGERARCGRRCRSGRRSWCPRPGRRRARPPRRCGSGPARPPPGPGAAPRRGTSRPRPVPPRSAAPGSRRSPEPWCPAGSSTPQSVGPPSPSGPSRARSPKSSRQCTTSEKSDGRTASNCEVRELQPGGAQGAVDGSAHRPVGHREEAGALRHDPHVAARLVGGPVVVGGCRGCRRR